MGGEDEGLGGWPPSPSGAPLYLQKEDHWTHFDNSVNAISFGFVATAILISMFLVMAIYEKFLRTASPVLSSAGGLRLQSDIEAHNRIGGFNAKLGYSSPKRTVLNAREFSVLMPGDMFPHLLHTQHPSLVLGNACIGLHINNHPIYKNVPPPPELKKLCHANVKLCRNNGAGY